MIRPSRLDRVIFHGLDVQLKFTAQFTPLLVKRWGEK